MIYSLVSLNNKKGPFSIRALILIRLKEVLDIWRTSCNLIIIDSLPTLKVSQIVLYSNKQLKKLFPPWKDKIAKDFKNNIVYQVTCQCGLHYIGQTKQWLKSRLYNHNNDIKKLKKTTGLFKHSIEEHHSVDFPYTKIPISENNLGKRLLYENYTES